MQPGCGVLRILGAPPVAAGLGDAGGLFALAAGLRRRSQWRQDAAGSQLAGRRLERSKVAPRAAGPARRGLSLLRRRHGALEAFHG